MLKNEVIKEISFVKTSDPLQSAGLATLIEYIEENFKGKVEYSISGNEVRISSDDVGYYLNEAFLKVCGEYYDTSTKKQEENKDGVYYDKVNDKFERYVKIKPVGYAQLINNSRPLAISGVKPIKLSENKELLKHLISTGKLKEIENREIENEKKKKTTYQVKFDDNDKENNTSSAKVIIDPEKNLLINGGNSAIPFIGKIQLKQGNKTCTLCGGKFADTNQAVKLSPFMGGESAGMNFVSMLKKAEETCWKCTFLNRLSVGKFLYYTEIKGKKDQKLFCFTFCVDSLEGLIEVNNKFLPTGFFLSDPQRKDQDYKCNFYLFDDPEGFKGCYHFHEIMLALLYTVHLRYKAVVPVSEVMSKHLGESLYYNTSVFYVFGRKFGSGLRPQKSGMYSDLNYIFKLLDLMVLKGINLRKLYNAAIDYSVNEGKINKKYDLSVASRDRLAEAILNKKPAISIWETILCRNPKSINNYVVEFIKIYETFINYGGNMSITDEIRERALNLGKSIGKAASNDKNPKIGKAKIIQLRKARDLNTYLDIIISLQSRYNLVVSKELLEGVNNENFEYTRQFSVIQALNVFYYAQKEKQNKPEKGK
jgi:hypothetical protein